MICRPVTEYFSIRLSATARFNGSSTGVKPPPETPFDPYLTRIGESSTGQTSATLLAPKTRFAPRIVSEAKTVPEPAVLPLPDEDKGRHRPGLQSVLLRDLQDRPDQHQRRKIDEEVEHEPPHVDRGQPCDQRTGIVCPEAGQGPPKDRFLPGR